MRVGILGGTGFSQLFAKSEELRVDTPWGRVTVGHRREGDAELFLVKRHGDTHAPPHKIGHRANIDALARCHVDAVIALNAVGALDASSPPGSLLIPDDYVDLRKTTETFHDDRAIHVDVTQAYCPHLGALLVEHAAATGTATQDGGVYVCTEGPRLETRAEIRMLRAMGGSVVGMTGCPEAALARERGLCYASLCLVTNPAAGVDAAPLVATELKAGADALGPTAMRAAIAAARSLAAERACTCRRALDGAAI